MTKLIEQFGHEKRWVTWKYKVNKGRKTKVPYSVSGRMASSTNSETWSTHSEVVATDPDHLGIVFTPTMDLLGLDIDHCLNKKTKNIEHEQKETIAQLILEADTYTEISPSGEGLHLFLKISGGQFDLKSNRRAPYEAYSSGRYFTVTSNVYGEDKPVREVTQDEANKILAIIDYPWEEKEADHVRDTTKQIAPTTLDDAQVLEKMFASKNGTKIKKLYDGDLSDHKDDHSIADLSLCSHLAFWTGKDATQIERIWLESPLGNRKKTQGRTQYRQDTISKAIQSCREVYVSKEQNIKSENDEEKEIVREFIKNTAKGTYFLAQYLTRKFNIITIGEREREMYVYRNGIYFRAENEIIYPEIQRILGHTVTKTAKNETFHKIADMTSSPQDIFQMTDIRLIPLKNGVYNFETKELLPHSPDYKFIYQFPIVYNPDATCPKTEAFLNQVLNDFQRPTIQEWLGYYFYRLYAFKKAIIFVGEGDTGKTTLLETIIYLLGKDNISSVSLQKMSSDKFAAAHLYGKHGNLVDELSAKDISDTGNFKIATGGGSISGEYKFGNQFSFQNFSKFTFACNKIPDVKDFDDEAYFNRWMVIRFENPITDKIPNFIQSLTTEDERSGLFNFAMDGLRRLLAEGKFTYAKSAIDTKLEMMRSGSSIAMFAAEKVTQSIGAEISKEDMYEAYTTHCAENGLAAETIKMFGTKFLFYVSYAAEGLITTINGKAGRVRGWRNVEVIRSIDDEERNKKVDEEFDSIPSSPTEISTADITKNF